MTAKAIGVGICALVLTTTAAAELVSVKDRRGRINLESQHFTDHHTFEGTRYIRELHYDADRDYLIYKQKSNYYQRCDVPQGVVSDWIASPSPDSFYRANVLEYFGCCKGCPPDVDYTQ
jgi:hypothetical protein